MADIVRDVSPPWSSALAGELERARQRLLVAFIELRSRLLQMTGVDFAGGEAERAAALAQTEHDYLALIEVGAEAARLQPSARQATGRRLPWKLRRKLARNYDWKLPLILETGLSGRPVSTAGGG